MHKSITKKMRERKSTDDLNTLADIVDMSLDKFKEEDADFYDYLETLLYEKMYGKVISEEMAHDWVSNMKPRGEHWNMEETAQAMRQLGYNLNKIDFYVVANMMYNDYYNLIENDETLALKMAKEWLTDVDVKENKLYNYKKYVVC